MGQSDGESTAIFSETAALTRAEDCTEGSACGFYTEESSTAEGADSNFNEQKKTFLEFNSGK
ncbi:unnamed protein product [Cylicostephanus goldi]|uniref:Uncharacterized protein n=1 Tax=Cylicostephanus goldi TaxID=71465 RepID=A0A3P7P2H3_CYLGO|nr:unnamed protein product [Cylicostephanus goldi]